MQTSEIVRWNVYESSEGYDRFRGGKMWGEWVLVGSHKTEDSASRQIELRQDANHAKNSMNDYGIVAVRWEKRHELMLPADSKVTQLVSVTDSEDVNQLQNQVTELQKQVKSLEGKLNYLRSSRKELEEEVTELVQQNSSFKNGEVHRRIVSELRQAQFEVQGLRQENQELQNKLQIPVVGNYVQPDFEAIRDRTLKKLKIGRQSAAGKAIDVFIKEAQRK